MSDVFAAVAIVIAMSSLLINIICNNTWSPPGIRLLSYTHDLGPVKEEKTGRLERRGESQTS